MLAAHGRLALFAGLGSTLLLGPAQVAVAAGATSADQVTHTVYVARPTNVGVSSMSDEAALDALADATAYWMDEADDRIESFVLPTGPDDTARFVTFQTDAAVGDVCDTSAFFQLTGEAAALFPDARFEPNTGDSDILVVLTPDTLPGGATCTSSYAGTARIGSGFHTGGSLTARTTPTMRGTLAHEMGHLFGFGHSNIGAQRAANLYNVMGLAIDGATAHTLTALSTAYRVGSGITAAGEVAAVGFSDSTAPRELTFTLRPRSEEAGLRGLAVTPPDTRSTFYVEYRSGTGQDARSSYADGLSSGGYWFGPGVVVEEAQRTASGAEVSLLPYLPKSPDQSGTAAAVPGQTWTSPSGTVSVSVVSMSEKDGATVTVTYTAPSPFRPGVATVGGEPRLGSTLTADQAGFTPDPDDVAWQWLRGSSEIEQATGRTYVPTAADVGHELAVRVTAYKPGVRPTAVTSSFVVVLPGVRSWSAAPQLSVTSPVEGRPVIVEYGHDGDPAGETIEWFADGKIVAGATGPTFTPGRAHVGKRLTARVAVRAPHWTTLDLITEQSEPVAADPSWIPSPSPDPDPNPTPDPSGTPSPGVTPTTPTTPTTATTPTTTTTPTTPTPPAPTHTATAPTTPTTTPAVPSTLTGPRPTVEGRPFVGKRLRVRTGAWPAGTTYSYRWLADGKMLRKATSRTLMVKPRLLGKRVSVRVTVSKPGYPSVTVVSTRTRRVRG